MCHDEIFFLEITIRGAPASILGEAYIWAATALAVTFVLFIIQGNGISQL